MRFIERLIAGLVLFLTTAAAHAQQPLVKVCGDVASPDSALAACAEALESGRWTGAEAAWLHNNTGLAHAARVDYLKALDAFDAAIAAALDYAPAFSNRGNTSAAIGDMLAALADHEHALRLDPGLIAARHNRAVDLEELGRYADALAAYRDVLKRAPGQKGARVGLATASCKLGRVKASAEARLAAIERGALEATKMQELLKAEGHYRGPIDGIFGKGSRAALWAWTRAGCRAPA